MVSPMCNFGKLEWIAQGSWYEHKSFYLWVDVDETAMLCPPADTREESRFAGSGLDVVWL